MADTLLPWEQASAHPSFTSADPSTQEAMRQQYREQLSIEMFKTGAGEPAIKQSLAKFDEYSRPMSTGIEKMSAFASNAPLQPRSPAQRAAEGLARATTQAETTSLANRYPEPTTSLPAFYPSVGRAKAVIATADPALSAQHDIGRDLAASGMKAVTGIGKAAYGLADVVSRYNPLQPASAGLDAGMRQLGIAPDFQRADKAINENVASAEYQRQQNELDSIKSNKGGVAGIAEDAYDNAAYLLKNPGFAALKGIETIPQMIASMGAGGAVARKTASAIAGTAEKAALEAGATAVAAKGIGEKAAGEWLASKVADKAVRVAGSATEGGLAVGNAAQSVRERLDEFEVPAELAGVKRKLTDEEKTKAMAVADKWLPVVGLTGLISYVLGGAESSLVRNAVGKEIAGDATKGIIGKAAGTIKGGTSEGLEEVLQAFPETIGQNMGERTFDPNKGVTDGLGASIGQGAVLGAAMGGVQGIKQGGHGAAPQTEAAAQPASPGSSTPSSDTTAQPSAQAAPEVPNIDPDALARMHASANQDIANQRVRGRGGMDLPASTATEADEHAAPVAEPVKAEAIDPAIAEREAKNAALGMATGDIGRPDTNAPFVNKRAAMMSLERLQRADATVQLEPVQINAEQNLWALRPIAQPEQTPQEQTDVRNADAVPVRNEPSTSAAPVADTQNNQPYGSSAVPQVDARPVVSDATLPSGNDGKGVSGADVSTDTSEALTPNVDPRNGDVAASTKSAPDAGKPQSDGTSVAFQRGKVDNESAALRAFSERPDFFRNVKSDKKSLQDITADVDDKLEVSKGSSIGGEQLFTLTRKGYPGEARVWVRKGMPYSGERVYDQTRNDEGQTEVRSNALPGEKADTVDPAAPEVYLDVSQMSPGFGGSRIYSIVANFAHNNGMRFIGDPNGLSDEAMRRRPENMLSSALKFGTTEHLVPHPRQIAGDQSIGVPPLRWVHGDHVGNVHRLIDVTMKSTQNAVHDDAAASRNPTVDSLETESGSSDGRNNLAPAASTGVRGKPPVGDRTASRAALFEAASRDASGERSNGGATRDGPLGAGLPLVDQLASDGKHPIFYQRGDADSVAPPGGMPVATVKFITEALTKSWKNAPPIKVIGTMDEAPREVYDAYQRANEDGADGEARGFINRDGTVYVVASAAHSDLHVFSTIFHEVLGHAGLRGVFGKRLNKVLDGVADLRAQDVAIKAVDYGYAKAVDADGKPLNAEQIVRGMTPENRRMAAEEVLAELAETYPNVKEKGLIQRAIGAIRAWLVENFPKVRGFVSMTDQDIIRNYIAPARDWIKNGVDGRRATGQLALQRSTVEPMANDKPLTASKFESGYFQHVDVRGRSGGTQEQTLSSIMKDGFKAQYLNALPVTRGTPPTDVISRNYAPRAGDLVYLVPKASVKDNKVLPGWKPQPYEAIRVTSDNPDMYAEYLAAFKKANEQAAPKVVDMKEGGARSAINALSDRAGYEGVQRTATPERPVKVEPASMDGAAASEVKRTPFAQETETLPRGALTDKLLTLRAVSDKLNRPHVYKVLALINEASKSKTLGSVAVFDAAKAEMKSLIEQANALTDNPSLKGFVGGQWGSVPKKKAVQPVARASSPKPSIALSAIDGLLEKADQATDQSERLDTALDAMKLAVRNGSAAAEDLFWQARDIALSVVEEANSKLESDFLTSGVFKNPENLMRNRDVIEIIQNGENPQWGIHDHSAKFDRATLNIVSSGNWSIDRLTNTADFRITNEPTTSQDGDVAFSRSDTITINGKERSRTNSNGKPIAATDEGLRNFYKWFGDSRAVDADGKPLVVYHGTQLQNETIDAFSIDKAGTKTDSGWMGRGFYFGSPMAADAYAGYNAMSDDVPTGSTVYPAYLSIQRPAMLMDSERNDGQRTLVRELLDLPDTATTTEVSDGLSAAGYDGAIYQRYNADGKGYREYVAFSPNQVKSSTGNNGQFSPDNADIRFQRANNKREGLMTSPAKLVDQVSTVIENEKTFNGLNRSLNTQAHKAWKSPEFRKVYTRVQTYIKDTARFAHDAASQAPTLLPAWERILGANGIISPSSIKRDITGKTAQERRNVGKAIFEGTLNDKRIYDAKELTERFKLTPREARMYTEALKATHASLDDLAVSSMAKLASTTGVELDVRGMPLMEAHAALTEAVQSAPKPAPDVLADIDEIASRVADLKDEAYFPLMRFGQYTLSVTDTDGETKLFRMYESERARARDLADVRTDPQFKGMSVVTGNKAEQTNELYRGLSPDALEVFAQTLGASDKKVFQDYLRVAVANRSAMKRLIERKGIAGFNEDVTRTLSSFITSNARLTSRNYHWAEALKSAAAIPKERGDVGDEAAKLLTYVSDNKEEAGFIRNLMFVNFLGGSIASAALNATQPFVVTAPYLSQWGGGLEVGKALTSIAKVSPLRPALKEAMDRATVEGIIAPHEIHNLYAESDNGWMDRARIPEGAQIGVRRGLLLWGSMFAAAESFNRKVSFMAGYNTYEQMTSAQKDALRLAGTKDAYTFAEKTVDDTQFVYNKGNRPNWARGAVGATLFTFKTFTVSMLETMAKASPQAKVLMAASLILIAGAKGLPFEEDAEDIIDTLGQAMGYNTNSGETIERMAYRLLGNTFGGLFLHGLSGAGVAPFDVSARMGMANIIPGTGIFLQSKDAQAKTKEISEAFGAFGGLVTQAMRGLDAVQSRGVGAGLAEGAPTTVANILKGLDMLEKGMYRDTKGRKVMDTTPTDAVVKMAGFQPAKVAKEQRAFGMIADDVALVKNVERDISDKWARAELDKLHAKTPSKIQFAEKQIAEAQDELAKWNAKNPESQISIRGRDIARRVEQMEMDKERRTIKLAPKEMRSNVMDTLRNTR